MAAVWSDVYTSPTTTNQAVTPERRTDTHPALAWSQVVETFSPGATTAAQANQVWTLTGSTPPTVGEGDGPEFMHTGTPDALSWVHTWLTISMPSDLNANPGVGTLQPEHVDNPDVLAVQWETDLSAPESVVGAVKAIPNVGEFFEYKTSTVLIQHGAGDRYEPPAQTRATVLAHSSPGAIYYDPALPWTLEVPLSVAAGSSFAMSVVDPWTSSGTVVPHDSDYRTNGALHFGVTVRGIYRPRYRVLREVAFDPPYLRNVQRGDGLGFSSAPRAFQNSTQQASLRNFGTF